MTLGMFCLSINDMTYKNLSFNFPVWEAVFFRALSGSIISIFLVYYSFALLLTSIIFFPADFIMPDTLNLFLAFSLGVMGSLGHLFMSQAAKNADVAITSPFEYSSFVFVGIMGYLFFAEIPSQSIIYGGILIILSGAYVAYRERINK